MKKKAKSERKQDVYNGRGLLCQDCGIRSVEVKHKTCPFDEEIYDKITPVDLCPDCYKDRLYEI